MYAPFQLLYTLFSFLLGISLIVAIHEFGHLLMAKFFRIGVKRYMVFFPPKIFSWQWRGTEYGIGSIPLGGFVEIEGMGEEYLISQKLPSSDFRTKPAWQRAFVMVGGILFNLISAYFILIFLLLIIGKPYLSKESMNEHGITPTELGKQAGIMRGDKIIQVNGHDFSDFTDLKKASSEYKTLTYTILREKETIEISIPPYLKEQLIEKKDPLYNFLVPYTIKKVLPKEGASQAGLEPGDQIITINHIEVPYLEDLIKVLTTYSGQKVVITYQRNGQHFEREATISAKGKIGIGIEKNQKIIRKSYRFIEVPLVAGQKVSDIIHGQFRGILKIIKREVSFRESVQSPIGIATLFAGQQDFTGFLWLIALLSIVLAFMNLLPIPTLDGFHLLLAIAEMITGKAVPYKIQARIQQFGLVLLVSLTLFLMGNDLYKIVANYFS